MQHAAVIVRKDRKRLATALRAFVNSELTLTQLGEELHWARDSRDTTVTDVVEQLGEDWEDLVQSPQPLDKSGWDWVQRLLLLLDSNGRIVREHRWHWCHTQLVALATLVVVVCLVLMFGWQWGLWVTAPATLVSLLLLRIRLRKITRPYQNVLMPFGTFEQLKRTYDSVPVFRKQRYPFARKSSWSLPQKIASSVGTAVILGWLFAMLVMVPPFSLLLQLLPIHEERVDVAIA